MADMDEIDYLDPNGYWIDPDKNIHRAGNHQGEQEIILLATDLCSEAEWDLMREALRIVCEKRSIDFVDWYGRERIN